MFFELVELVEHLKFFFFDDLSLLEKIYFVVT